MRKVYLGGLFLSLLFVPACRKCTDPTNAACSNYNPCYNQQPTTAQFNMIEYCDTALMYDPVLASHWRFYDSDSALDKVTFTAALDSATYEWHIGSGIYTSQSFTLDFTAAPRPSVIPITLIVHKQPNLKCFPGGKGSDTLTRNLSIIENPVSDYFTGTYQGAFEDEPDTKITYSIIRKSLTGIPSFEYDIINFFSDGDTTQIGTGSSNDLTTIRQRYFACGNIIANLNIAVISYLNYNRQVIATFEEQNQATAIKSIRIFNGQKIQ